MSYPLCQDYYMSCGLPYPWSLCFLSPFTSIPGAWLSNNFRHMATLEYIVSDVGLVHGLAGSPEARSMPPNLDTAGRGNGAVAIEW